MRSTVLAYHAVGDVSPEDDPFNLWVPTEVFRRQMAYLAEHRAVVSLDDLVGGSAPSGAVAVTFDDGYTSVLHEAAPILQHFGLKATVFVSTAYVGDRNRWDAETNVPLEIMDAEQLREVDAAGVTVESHGHGHVDLSEADEAVAHEDLAASVEQLTDLMGRAPRFVAFPFRTGSTAARQAAAKLGFQAAFTIDLPHDGDYGWGRVGVAPRDSMALFGLKTSGRYLALRHNPVLAGAYQLVKRAIPR